MANEYQPLLFGRSGHPITDYVQGVKNLKKMFEFEKQQEEARALQAEYAQSTQQFQQRHAKLLDEDEAFDDRRLTEKVPQEEINLHYKRQGRESVKIIGDGYKLASDFMAKSQHNPVAFQFFQNEKNKAEQAQEAYNQRNIEMANFLEEERGKSTYDTERIRESGAQQRAGTRVQKGDDLIPDQMREEAVKAAMKYLDSQTYTPEERAQEAERLGTTVEGLDRKELQEEVNKRGAALFGKKWPGAEDLYGEEEEEELAPGGSPEERETTDEISKIQKLIQQIDEDLPGGQFAEAMPETPGAPEFTKEDKAAMKERRRLDTKLTGLKKKLASIQERQRGGRQREVLEHAKSY